MVPARKELLIHVARSASSTETCAPNADSAEYPGLVYKRSPWHVRATSATDETSGQFGILSIAPQLIHGAANGSTGGPSLVFLAGDLLGLADDNARGPDRLFPRLGIGGYSLCRVADDTTQEEGHGGTLANRAVCRQTGG